MSNDVATHMLLLLQRVQTRYERPVDASFVPLELTCACLLQQLPPGLAPSFAEGLSLHELDDLPERFVTHRLETLVCGSGNESSDPRQVLAFVESLVQYVRVTRVLLRECHAHMANQQTALDATQHIVDIVVTALGSNEGDGNGSAANVSDNGNDNASGDESEFASKSDGMSEFASEFDDVSESVSEGASESATKSEAGRSDVEHVLLASPAPSRPLTPPPVPMVPIAPTSLAVNPSEVMKRAMSRDVGDGSAVLALMRKYASDERIQTRGVRALRAIVARDAQRAHNDAKSAVAKSRRRRDPTDSSSESSDDSSEERNEPPVVATATTRESLHEAIEWVIGCMQRQPEHLALQRDALLCLADYVSGGPDTRQRVAAVTIIGGIARIMEAMARLPDDLDANVAGLAVFAHPQIADESVVHVDPESRRLVISAMKRFPLSEQVQGLSCLALANLSVRQDESMLEIVAKGGLDAVVAAMVRFPRTSMLQAAGCWLLGIVSAKNAEMTTACLDAGALPVCERARVRFPDDAKVQQNAVFAIERLVDALDAVVDRAAASTNDDSHTIASTSNSKQVQSDSSAAAAAAAPSQCLLQ